MPIRTVDCPTKSIALGRVGRRVIAASFNGGDLSGDAGVLLLRRADECIGLTRAIARVVTNGRRAASVTHPLHFSIAQRLYALCFGWVGDAQAWKRWVSFAPLPIFACPLPFKNW